MRRPTAKQKKLILDNIYRQAKLYSRRMRQRVVLKNGDCNVVKTNLTKRRLRYLADIFTTLVDIQWRWTLLVFTLSFIMSWLIFAALWFLVCFTHGDLEIENLPDGPMQSSGNFTPCVMEIYNFASCFLFSLETQHTIGYGTRHTTEECPVAIVVMCCQSISGVMIQAFMVGVVFAKLSRPKMRAQTLLFSRNAVICLRDGMLCLMFRVGDMRKSHIINASVRAQIIRTKVTQEGELIQYYQQDLPVGAENGDNSIFFVWPITIVHIVNSASPLYNLSAADILKEKFEIVIILEGTVESTSMTTQARSSYIPTEILWGHRFQNMVSFRKDTATHNIDYSLFDSTYEVDTPLCSARELDEFKRAKEETGETVIQFPPDQILPGLGAYSPLTPSSNGSQFYNVYTTFNSIGPFDRNTRFPVGAADVFGPLLLPPLNAPERPQSRDGRDGDVTKKLLEA
ncbi:ATP-sensitive inward rectifier potassium channel 12-like isoform X3 [Artemia franciscana]|uniref:Uncharacterized protein n=1 Tax=Artemia franciscana TaxID=6661 RepID=A0AA88L307_ARTSF|nr:hypothetical protein QYM36_009048 [Artemia franciscana]